MTANPSRGNPYPVTRLLLLIVVAFALISAVHLVLDWQAMAKARKLKNPVPPTAEAIAAGLATYQQHCQSCHGKNGDGKGEKASELSVAPGDFTDAQKMAGFADGELYWQITKGRHPMPAFQHKLTDEQRWQLVDYIRTFAGKPERKTSATAGLGTK